MALDVVAQRRYNHGEHIVPFAHLDGQDGQAHAQLYPDGLWARRIPLQEDEELTSESGQVRLWHLGCKVVCDLPKNVSVPANMRYPESILAYLSLQCGGGKELCFGFGGGLEDADGSGPSIFLLFLVSAHAAEPMYDSGSSRGM